MNLKALTLFSVVLASLIVFACSQPDAGSDSAVAVIAGKIAGVAPESNIEWLTHGNGHGEQRHSALSKVNDNNVADLGLAWSFDLGTNRGVEATPLVVGGTMYVTASWSVVYALDAKDGSLNWSYDPKVDRAWGVHGCCDAVNRGVAYDRGKVFVGAFDGRLIALDAANGNVLWEVQTTDKNYSYTITGAPRVVRDNVIIGNGGAELGVRGFVAAYNVNTGEKTWQFYTVPGNPADGFESPLMEKIAKTWSGEWWKWGGGGTVWDSMAYDPELDLFYVGVGNGSPWNQELRSPKGGDNLFLSSIVAIRPDTGEYVWHYQTTPGESWDFTATQHMILADLEIDGKKRAVIMQAPKNGFFYVIDRATGELISANNYTEVNWATGIDMDTGRPIEVPEARDFSEDRMVLPGAGGGHNWPPMSYHPETGLVYIPAMNFPFVYKSPTNDLDKKPKQGFWNLGFDTMAMAAPEIPNINEVLASLYFGKLVAWDPVKQEARWTVDSDRISGGGILSTAGNLVFQGDRDGALAAYNAKTGDKLWSFWTQTGSLAAPISYSIDGEQYLAQAVGWGGGFATQGGGVSEPYGMRNIPRVLVFKLGAKLQLPAAPEKLAMTKPAAVTADADTILQGKMMYHRYCYYCHGDSARSGGVIRDLRYSTFDDDMWQSVVIDGVLESIGMVSFKEYLTEGDVKAVRQYVLQRANIAYDQRTSQ